MQDEKAKVKGTFTIQGRLSGLNEMIAMARTNRYGAAGQKKKETGRCAWAAIAGGLPRFKDPVKVHVDWIEPNEKRDPDNTRAGLKYVLDGLVVCGKLPGDGRKWVVGLSDSFPPPDALNPRVIVTVESVSPSAR